MSVCVNECVCACVRACVRAGVRVSALKDTCASDVQVFASIGEREVCTSSLITNSVFKC